MILPISDITYDFIVNIVISYDSSRYIIINKNIGWTSEKGNCRHDYLIANKHALIFY